MNKIMQSKLSMLNGMVVDNFAGGGGASTGIELALGRPVDIAINHDEDAIAMHEANHPFTKHFCESVWDIDPRKATEGRPVMLAWFSPDCCHFSRARGCKPVEKNIRSLAWVAVKWAATVKPRVILLENVKEFQTWGPLDENNIPIKEESGKTFQRFVSKLRELGYTVEWRELKAHEYGAPTIRERFFLVARCDGEPIRWPEPTHGPDKIPYRAAAEIIDWSLPCPSIFETSEEIMQKHGIRAVRPLAESTMRRIARGIQKFVIDNPQPYIVTESRAAPLITSIGQTGFSIDRSRSIESPLSTIVSKAEHCLVAPMLIQYHSETGKSEVRGQTVDKPIMTTDTSNRYAEVTAFITKYFSGGCQGKGSDVNDPLGTVTAADHNAIVAASIVKFKHNDTGQAADEPLHTICASTVHFAEVRTLLSKYCGPDVAPGLVNIEGEKYAIFDIGLRMLTPRELFKAQGFPGDYIIDYTKNGKLATKSAQVARCGNSVCPALAEALVRANLPDQCGRKIVTMEELDVEFGVVG